MPGRGEARACGSVRQTLLWKGGDLRFGSCPLSSMSWELPYCYLSIQANNIKCKLQKSYWRQGPKPFFQDSIHLTSLSLAPCLLAPQLLPFGFLIGELQEIGGMDFLGERFSIFSLHGRPPPPPKSLLQIERHPIKKK